MECLQRAFEVAINYSVYHKKEDKKNLELHYDIELLATGKRTKNLAQKYQKAKEKAEKTSTKKASSSKKASASKKTKSVKQQTTMKSCQQPKKITPYWIIVGIFSLISLCMMIFLLITK